MSAILSGIEDSLLDCKYYARYRIRIILKNAWIKPKNNMGSCLSKGKRNSKEILSTSINDIPLEIKTAQEIINPPTGLVRKFLSEIISDHYLFRGLDLPDIDMIITKMRFLVVPMNQIIIQQGDPGKFFYVINSGRAEIIVNGNSVGNLGRGNSFGELALLTSHNRSATIKSLEKCALWALDSKSFKSAIKSIFSSNKVEIKKILFKNSIFASLQETQKQELLKRASLLEFADREVIISEGHISNFVYIIKSGEVFVEVNNQKIAVLAEERMFGESALLGKDTKRTATIRASGTAQVICLDSQHIIEIVGENYKQIFYKNIIMNALAKDEDIKFLNIEHVIEVTNLFQIKNLKPGDVAIPGDNGLINNAYVVCYGKISSGEAFFETYELVGLDNSNHNKAGTKEFICEIDTVLAEIPISQAETAMRVSIKALRSTIKKLNTIHMIGLFGSLEFEAIEFLSSKMEMVTFAKNETIYKEKSEDDDIFIIFEGSVGLYQGDVLISKLDKNSVFGETCIVTKKQTCAALSLTPTSLGKILKRDLIKVLTESMINQIKRKEYYTSNISLEHLYAKELLQKTYNRYCFLSIVKSSKVPYIIEIFQKYFLTSHHEFDQMVNLKATLLQIDHPQIPKLIKTFSDPANLYFVYEHFPFKYLSEFHGSKFSEKSGIFVLLSLTNILGYLSSKNILHRDICPTNIMIDDSGYIWLHNFRKAKITEDRTFSILEDPAYMAKEALLGRGYTRAAEYWSLGVVLYEMVCGYLPFEISDGDSPEGIRGKVLKSPLVVKEGLSKGMAGVIRGLLNEDPEKRMKYEEIVADQSLSAVNFKQICRKAEKSPIHPNIVVNSSLKLLGNISNPAICEGIMKNHYMPTNTINWDQFF